MVIGSPGLLREGTVVGEHYDGYGVLRTVESAFRLGSLHRFDEFAVPLSTVFAGSQPDREGDGGLHPTEASATRGSLADTFGRVATPAAVEQGMPLSWLADDVGDDAVVNLEPLGRKPTADSIAYRFNTANGTVTVPTEGLTPGYYEAWLRREREPPARAPVPAIVLPPVAQITGHRRGRFHVGPARDSRRVQLHAPLLRPTRCNDLEYLDWAVRSGNAARPDDKGQCQSHQQLA